MSAAKELPKEIADILTLQREALDKIEKKHVKAMLLALANAKKELTLKLTSSRSTSQFTLDRHRLMLVQIEDAMHGLSAKTDSILRSATSAAMNQAIVDLVAQIDISARVFSFEPIIPMREVHGFVTGNSKLRSIEAIRVRRGAAKYAADTIDAMERQMAQALLTNQTVDSAARQILGSGPWADKPWKAERLVRTEFMHAYNASERVALDEIAKDDKHLWIEWVEHAAGPKWAGPDNKPWPGMAAPLDNRVAHDSRRMHGQLRRPGQLFQDPVTAIQYAHPPMRPNDRAVLALVRVEPKAKKTDAPTVEASE